VGANFRRGLPSLSSRAIAAQTAKQNLCTAYWMTREEAIQYERDLQTICFATEGAAEGRQAFQRERKPAFLGR
jgi:hypothetical protein